MWSREVFACKHFDTFISWISYKTTALTELKSVSYWKVLMMLSAAFIFLPQVSLHLVPFSEEQWNYLWLFIQIMGEWTCFHHENFSPISLFFFLSIHVLRLQDFIKQNKDVPKYTKFLQSSSRKSNEQQELSSSHCGTTELQIAIVVLSGRLWFPLLYIFTDFNQFHFQEVQWELAWEQLHRIWRLRSFSDGICRLWVAIISSFWVFDDRKGTDKLIRGLSKMFVPPLLPASPFPHAITPAWCNCVPAIRACVVVIYYVTPCFSPIHAVLAVLVLSAAWPFPFPFSCKTDCSILVSQLDSDILSIS